MIAIDYKPLSHYVDMLNNGIPFSFARYWDGEIECMIDKKGLGYNCDRCHYTAELRAALLKTITNNYDYYHALNQPKSNMATKSMQDQFEKLLESMQSKVKWFDFMVFQYAVETGNFAPILRALKGRKVLFIGGKHLWSAMSLLPNAEFYEAPQTDAFNSLNDIESFCTRKSDISNLVIILCVGMAANVFIVDLYPKYGKSFTMIDMGSVWDAMLGLKKRRWIRNIAPDKMRKNYV